MTPADSRLASILGEWRSRLDRGDEIDPEKVIADHPDLADELRAQFKALSKMRHAQATKKAPTELRTLPIDRYSEFKSAGEGGMGIVYWAIDTDLNREVAFKIIRPDSKGGDTPMLPTELTTPARDTPASQSFETLKQRFLQEAWITSGMAHPGIVPVYELGETPEGVPYYTMRFIKGETTLATAIDANKGAGIEERLALLEPFLKICDALRYAHSRGVIHRDLKPENVALGEFGEAVVLDWGLAKVQGGEQPDGDRLAAHIQQYRDATDLKTIAGAMGTPGYMPPEAVLHASEKMDARSDVFSLGAILFEILTGRMPHEFTTFGELVTKLLEQDPPRATEIDDAVPEALSDLCASCLSRKMDERPPSATVLAEAIRTWQIEREKDREIEGFLREAKTALEGAEALRGADMLQQVDRATVAVSQVLKRRTDSVRALSLRARAASLREQGIHEREKASTRRLLVRGGIGVLAVAAVVAFFVAGAFDRKAREAERERDAVLRLSDAKTARDLVTEVDRLWPIRSDMAPAMGVWLDRAREVVKKRGNHEAALAQVRKRFILYTEEERRLEHGEALARLEAIAQRLDELDGETDADLSPDADAARAEDVQALRAEREEIEARTKGRFSKEDAWRHQVLSDLLRDLATLESVQIAEIEDRHAAARTLKKTSVDDNAEAWTETIARIGASAHYGGLKLAPQEGLIPLGPDPDSGLLEFAHMGSGSSPTRDPESRHLVYADDAAIVLVLIPGGTFLMGAQKTDPSGDNYDPLTQDIEGPVHRVTISAFFLAKHEWTQAQWATMTKLPNPSAWPAGGSWGGRRMTIRNPVNQVSCEESGAWLERHRLMLPTEAQWEYACRAGTDAPWSTGRDVAALSKVANICDAYCRQHGGHPAWPYSMEVVDGHTFHAPVGSFAPNAFGLFDVHGNVGEWCRDITWPAAAYAAGPRTNPVERGPGWGRYRGGSWYGSAWAARSACRRSGDTANRFNYIGVRPARPITQR